MATILLVEDNQELRTTFEEILSLEGYDVVQAENGKVATEKLQTASAIDLILCDYAMPEMNGLEVLAFVRNTPATESIPFIMMSGVRPPEVDFEHTFLAKPVGIEELIDLLHSLV
ncbi:MAG: response regulator [Chloroflexota bacterium]